MTTTMTRTRRTLAVMVAATAAAVATVSPARADHHSGPAPGTCPAGYVCVRPIAGTPILVPEGERRQFPGGVAATIANRTKVTYCVGGSPSFGLPPGGAIAELREIRAVDPQPPGGACLQ